MLTLQYNKDTLSIQSDTSNLVWSKEIDLKDLKDKTIYLNSRKNSISSWLSNKYFISNSGQYSQLGFEIESILDGSDKLVYKVKCDSVSLALLDGTASDSPVVDKIGEHEVLIIDITDIKIEDVLTISQNSNPKLVILLADKQSNEQIKQVLTQNLTLIENGYKIRSKDITGESTQYLILNK
jgi:hypothetical protein